MKRILLPSKIVLMIALIGCMSSFIIGPDCDSDAFLDSCAPSLGDYTFIKTFKVESKKPGDKTEYSYVFSKGSDYRIVICDRNEPGKKMIINFYDRTKKLIASNYLKSSKKIFPVVNYSCSATGVYYVEAYFEGDKNGCGINLLGFKKQ